MGLALAQENVRTQFYCTYTILLYFDEKYYIYGDI